MSDACIWQDIPKVNGQQWCKVHLHVRDSQDDKVIDDRPWKDIVDVISKFVSIRPFKRYFIGRCPFHDDTGCSLEVIRGHQRYRCIDCNNSGSALDFICNYLNISPEKALDYLRI